MARHEYNALNLIRNARIKGLVAPVQLLIDVQGFRLSATPLLPIGHAGSLVYGSDDAAVRVHVRGSAAVALALPAHTDLLCHRIGVCVNRPTYQQVKDAAFNGLMAQLATKLNLAAHVVGSGAEQTLVHTCADLEGHRGTDGRYYVVDAVHDTSSCSTRCYSLTCYVLGHSLRHASCHRFHLIEMLPKAPTSHASCGAKRCAPMQCRCHPTPLRGVQRLLLCMVSVPRSPRLLVWEQVRRGRCASSQPGGRGATQPVTAHLLVPNGLTIVVYFACVAELGSHRSAAAVA